MQRELLMEELLPKLSSPVRSTPSRARQLIPFDLSIPGWFHVALSCFADVLDAFNHFLGVFRRVRLAFGDVE